jgi:hypothetical protein
MKILVLGNCQARSLAAALAYLTGAETTHLVSATIADEAAAEAARDSLPTYDLVLSQPHKRFRALRPKIVERYATRSCFYPRFWFTGLHPDAIAVVDEPGFSDQFGGWHSTLALAAFVRGLTPAEAQALFNDEVFEALGYYEAYGRAEAAQAEAAAQFGFDFHALLAASRGRVFANTPSHPHLSFVLAFADQLAEQLELPRKLATDLPPDPLADGFIFPVYPEIGRRLGITGDMLFRKSSDGSDLSLAQMLDGAYAAYTTDRDHVAAHPQVAAAAEALQKAGV